MRVQIKNPAVARGLSMRTSTWERIDATAIERGIPVSRLIEEIVVHALKDADRMAGRAAS